jgi:hypothetical protein
MDKMLFLTKTQGEWEAIEDAIRKMGKKNLNTFIIGEVRRLGNAYTECPNCITKASGKKKCKRPKISIESYKKIEKISIQMGVPVSNVIDILIILPLLQGTAAADSR